MNLAIICTVGLFKGPLLMSLLRQVKPVIKLLKRTLLGTGILLATAVSLLIFATPVENFLQSLSHPKESDLVVSAAKASDLK